ncbi:unnamed protein product [Ectocarpus sp. 6 AP-2014]
MLRGRNAATPISNTEPNALQLLANEHSSSIALQLYPSTCVRAGEKARLADKHITEDLSPDAVHQQRRRETRDSCGGEIYTHVRVIVLIVAAGCHRLPAVSGPVSCFWPTPLNPHCCWTSAFIAFFQVPPLAGLTAPSNYRTSPYGLQLYSTTDIVLLRQSCAGNLCVHWAYPAASFEGSAHDAEISSSTKTETWLL